MSKKEREYQVLLGLVDFFIKTGKPVGSHTLKTAGFENLSSATIRNYFANLEEKGFLHQQHSSGGRLPTESAFRLYANHILENFDFSKFPSSFSSFDGFDESARAITTQLERTTDLLSSKTSCAAFLSAPRFDQDFVIDLKLLNLDSERCLCVILTDFGLVQTEVFHIPHKLSTFSVKRIEGYFQTRLSGSPLLVPLDPEEEQLAQQLYNEMMIRHLVNYTHFSTESLYSTGFAQLLNSPEFHDPKVLSTSLSLFEDKQNLRHLIQDSCRHAKLKIWIGNELASIGCPDACCSILITPYKIHNQIVGALGILGPMRIPYQEYISQLSHAANHISDALTRTAYKFKITFRQPKHGPLHLGGNEKKLLVNMPKMLLEDKRERKTVKKKAKGVISHG